MDFAKRHEDLILYRSYKPGDYPSTATTTPSRSHTQEIPAEFDGVMGVPITFLDKHNPDQFEIVGVTQSWFGGQSRMYPRPDPGQCKWAREHRHEAQRRRSDQDGLLAGKTYYKVDGESFVKVYARLLIRRKEMSVMKIELHETTVRELTEGYEDNQEDGVIGYGGKLDIRPPLPARIHLRRKATRRGDRNGAQGTSR